MHTHRASALVQAGLVAAGLGFALRHAAATAWWGWAIFGWAVLATLLPWLMGARAAKLDRGEALRLAVFALVAFGLGAWSFGGSAYRPLAFACGGLLVAWLAQLGASL